MSLKIKGLFNLTGQIKGIDGVIPPGGFDPLSFTQTSATSRIQLITLAGYPNSSTTGWMGAFADNGTKFYYSWHRASTSNQSYLAYYTASTPYDLSTLSFVSVSVTSDTAFTKITTGIDFNADGTKAIVSKYDSMAVYELGTPFVISSATAVNPITFDTVTNEFYGAQWADDYNKIITYRTASIRLFQMNTQYGLSGTEISNSNNFNALTPSLNNDGTKLTYIVSNGTVTLQSLSTPYDLTTGTLVGTLPTTGLSKQSAIYDNSGEHLVVSDVDNIIVYS